MTFVWMPLCANMIMFFCNSEIKMELNWIVLYVVVAVGFFVCASMLIIWLANDCFWPTVNCTRLTAETKGEETEREFYFYLIAYGSMCFDDTAVWSMMASINVTATAMPISQNTLYFSTDGQIKYVHNANTFRSSIDRILLLVQMYAIRFVRSIWQRPLLLVSLCCLVYENVPGFFHSVFFFFQLDIPFGSACARVWACVLNVVRRLIYDLQCQRI